MPSANPVRCGVLGAGSFGTCLALLLAQRDYAVDLWARDRKLADAIQRHRRNPRYLTEFRIPDNVRATSSFEETLSGKDLIISAVPSHGVRETWERAAPFVRPDTLIVSATKGIEVHTGKLMSQVLLEVLPPKKHAHLVSLSGPSFAHEVAADRPTGISLASANESFAIAAQSILSTPNFRCYTNTDVLGVELGGALKNVIAIAVGVCDGMGLGLNTRAMMMTRGLAELTRLGIRLGANPLTFLGLSGIGDLMLTCTGDLSRNRRVGLEIGRGKKVDEVLGGLNQVAEGVRTTQSTYELAREHDVDMPITEETYAVLYEAKDPKLAVRDLMRRQLRSEYE